MQDIPTVGAHFAPSDAGMEWRMVPYAVLVATATELPQPPSPPGAPSALQTEPRHVPRALGRVMVEWAIIGMVAVLAFLVVVQYGLDRMRIDPDDDWLTGWMYFFLLLAMPLGIPVSRYYRRSQAAGRWSAAISAYRRSREAAAETWQYAYYCHWCAGCFWPDPVSAHTPVDTVVSAEEFRSIVADSGGYGELPTVYRSVPR
ncbi:hypothetical protein [Nocardia transvalensis]|uniref:hypothetical protein n=1 Tax=Nocardia transvalensis TaxID=37333 RepID=UPI001894BE4B|nr:hypothetical protein [Nocardia transvalensis]MBF6331746.1 hypothetical protein [Nocardia transvalensis]